VSVPAEYDVNSENITILNAALAAGMYPKILTLNASGLQTITNQQPVSMVRMSFTVVRSADRSQHPSSINFRTSKADYGSNYLVYFTIMQSKKLYAWETGPVDDRALALFCGDNPDFKARPIELSVAVADMTRYRRRPYISTATSGIMFTPELPLLSRRCVSG